MSALGRPVVVVRAIVACDSGAHELDVVTDGRTGYVWGVETDAVLIGRDGVEVVARCSQPVGYDGDPCEEAVRIRLDVHETWSGSPDAIDMLVDHGQPIPTDN